jgi:hypothetical protein
MATKYFVLFTVLKSAGKKGASPEACAKELNFAVGSVAGYVAALRIKFGAEIEAVKDGRTTTAYVLKNVSVVEGNITPNRRSKGVAATPVAKKAKVAKPKPMAKAKVKVVEKPIRVPKKKTHVSDDGLVPTLDADLRISEVTDNELADIKAQLGLA